MQPSAVPPCRTLIVEDNATMRHVLRRLVQTLGQEADEAGTVAEAIPKIELCGIILLDLNLPDGYGVEILRRVRVAQLEVKVAVVSGTSDPALLEQATLWCPDRMFTKPPDFLELSDWLEASAQRAA